jgi:hypothetical protein
MPKLSTPMATKLRGLALSNYDSEPFDLDRDLPLAEEFVAALAAGKSPLADRTGDMRLAYRSAVDGTLQPFRVYVPKSYDAKKPTPLIVALHGATGDESTYLDRYVSGPSARNCSRSSPRNAVTCWRRRTAAAPSACTRATVRKTSSTCWIASRSCSPWRRSRCF